MRDSITHDPIEGIPVFDAFYGSGSIYSDLTDQDGRYTLEHVQLGTRNAPRDVVVHANAFHGAFGYWQAQATVGVQADQTSTQDFELIPVCEDATISGRVIDAATQEPIDRASVSGGGYFDETDANGEYRLEDVTIGTDNSPIHLQLTASATGYHTETKTVTVFCGASIELNFGLPTSAIEGYVMDVTNGTPGQPMEGVLIASGAGGAVTDANGYYKLKEVPLGPNGSPRTWDLKAEPAGFIAKTDSVTVRAGETARLDFEFAGATASPTLLIAKRSLGGTGSFSFTSTGLPSPADGSGNFTISTASSNPNEATFTDLTAGNTYTVAEPSAPGWDLADLSCSGATSSTVRYGSGATFVHDTWQLGDDAAQVRMADDETVTCTFTNTIAIAPDQGYLKINKLFEPGTSGFTGDFTIHYDCGDGDQTVSLAAGASTTVGPFDTGTSCTVSEPTTPQAPNGWTFGTPVISGSPATITTGNQAAAVEVRVTNSITLTPGTGRLKLAKSLSGGPHGYKGPFQINHDCTGTAFDGSVSVNAGSYQTVSGIPSGTVCTISETLPTPPAGYSFGTPTFSPSATVTISTAGSTVSVTTKNTLVRTGRLKLAKSLSGGPHGYKGPFQINHDCTGTAFDGSVSVNAGSYQTVSGIPSGTVCTISETLPTPPAGYSFGTPTFSPSATVTISTAGSTVSVTTKNTLVRTGRLKLAKSLSGGPHGYKGPFQINHDCTGTAFDGSVSVNAGSYQTVSGIPSGTVCTISETLPTPPAGYSFGTPTFSPSATVTIPAAGATVRVTTCNTLIRTPQVGINRRQ